MTVDYVVEIQPLAPRAVETIQKLCLAIFERPTPDLLWRLENMPRVSVVCARVGDELVGFKIGYAHGQFKYYSWLGGVHPSYSRQGIAMKLAELQHGWAKEQGFQIIETATDQTNASMTQANLKCGFVICGSKSKLHGIQVLFSKALS